MFLDKNKPCKDENIKDLAKYYPYVKRCSVRGCNQLYGSMTPDKAGVCPLHFNSRSKLAKDYWARQRVMKDANHK